MKQFKVKAKVVFDDMPESIAHSIDMYRPLSNHMQDAHGLILTESEMDDIIFVVKKVLEYEPQ